MGRSDTKVIVIRYWFFSADVSLHGSFASQYSLVR